jgi:hypothetical protein
LLDIYWKKLLKLKHALSLNVTDVESGVCGKCGCDGICINIVTLRCL